MKTIKKEDEGYPELLKHIKNAPNELYINGDTACFNMPCITVVGARNMSEYGKLITRDIVKELVLFGVCIVSGLAVGIDSVAHKTCLENNGKTIAVLGSGLNKIYPSENVELYNNILKNGGCVISEHEPDTEAQKIFFPARNRIVSGLSLGTLVIEAAYRSGTSITAKFAMEQGRKVFCIPNSVGNKNSSGTINLIKKGATMVTTGKEILYGVGLIDKLDNYEELIEQEKSKRQEMIEQEELELLDEQAKKIYFYIKENKVANTEIMCNELSLNVQSLNMYITILELKGLIDSQYGGNYTLRNELYV